VWGNLLRGGQERGNQQDCRGLPLMRAGVGSRCTGGRRMKIPLSGVEYTRKARQFQGKDRGWKEVIFYIRGIDRQREFYDNEIKKSNRIFVFGIWDPDNHSEENPPYEWAFSSDEDQVEMFRLVLKNLVKTDERKRFVKRILDTIEDYGMQVRLD